MHKRSTLGIMIASAILATGCGGGGGGSAPSGGGVTDGPDTVTLSGRAADGYLVQANVCADLNANAQCDAGEPTTTTGEGGKFSLEIPADQLAVELVVEAIGNLTVDEDTGQPVPEGFTLRSPILGEKDAQFVSPVTTMVANEMKNSSVTLERAKEIVAQRLNTSFDPVKNFIEAAKNSADDSEKQSAERLHRIAQVTARVMAQIESNVSQSDLDQAGLTMAEFLALASRQIEALISVIINDIDQTLGNPDFDPDSIVDSPDYTFEQPIDNETPDTGETPDVTNNMLADRISKAEDANPFYRDTPSGEQAVIGSTATYLEFGQKPDLSHRFYFEALEREMTSADGQFAKLTQDQSASDYFNGQYVAKRISPDNIRIKFFENSEQVTTRIYKGYMSEIDVTAQTNGTLASTTGTHTPKVGILSKYAKVDLSGLSTAFTISSLYPNVSINAFPSEAGSSIFPDGSAAYLLNETLIEPMYITSWHGLEGSNSNSETHCSPNAEISQVVSCNVLYGNESALGTAAPATSFDALTYPDSASVYTNTGVENGIGFESHGVEYYMYLFGDKSDGSGRIEVTRTRQSDGALINVGNGTWNVEDAPFEHIRLELPDGIYYPAFMSEVGGEGYAFLHEVEGFVRAGRATPAGVEVPTYFKRNPETLHLNETALNHVLTMMDTWDLLTQHPGWGSGQ